MTFKKSKVNKIFIVMFLILAIAVPVFQYYYMYANDYDFTITAYKMDVVVDDYGDMHIVESVTNKYSDRNTVFYKNLIYGKNNGFSSYEDESSLVKDVRVKVEDSRGVVFDTLTSENTSSHFVGYSYKYDRDELGNRIMCDYDVEDCEMIFISPALVRGHDTAH